MSGGGGRGWEVCLAAGGGRTPEEEAPTERPRAGPPCTASSPPWAPPEHRRADPMRSHRCIIEFKQAPPLSGGLCSALRKAGPRRPPQGSRQNTGESQGRHGEVPTRHGRTSQSPSASQGAFSELRSSLFHRDLIRATRTLYQPKRMDKAGGPSRGTTSEQVPVARGQPQPSISHTDARTRALAATRGSC